MSFLTDHDMLAAANGNTDEEATADLLQLHAAQPEQLADTDATPKFLDFYKRGSLKTLPPGPLQTLQTRVYTD